MTQSQRTLRWHRICLPSGVPTVMLTMTLNVMFTAHATPDANLSFAPQTGFESLSFNGNHDTAVVAGRDDTGAPRLALIHAEGSDIVVTERRLPDDAVAVDVGKADADTEALFVLCANRVLRLDAPTAELAEVAAVTSLYRGRSYAPLTSTLDFAQDIDNDDVAELLVQDFDVVTVLDGATYQQVIVLDLPVVRRSFERAQNFRPVRTASIPQALISVRGDELLRYSLDTNSRDNTPVRPQRTTLGLGLSSERDIERFYNGDDELDQRDVTLREPELLTDINGDGVPDLVTLETVSDGVFDKNTTYRLYLARSPFGFSKTPDTVISDEGYQFGLRTVELDDDRTALVAPGVRIGLGTIIGALFSRSVTLKIPIFAADDDGQFSDTPSAEVRAKVRFDFGSGQVELPTVEFGDLDGDGQRDLILKTGRDQLSWRRNLGQGAFASRGDVLDIEAPKDGSNVIAADFDGDGLDEILVRYGLQDGAERKRQVRLLDTVAIEP